MSQRASGFARRPNEDYATPAWVAAVIADYLRRRFVRKIWEPAIGQGALYRALKAEAFHMLGTGDNFLKHVAPPEPVDAIVTNPPYGDDRRGALACDFIRHALSFEVATVTMLLRVDFDFGKTRVDLFRDNTRFAGKIILLDRIKWFPGESGPSDNHAWFVWDRRHRGDAWIKYAEAAP